MAIADADGDGTQEIIAAGSGDSTGGTDTYRAWLLAIRNGTTFAERLYRHFDHSSGTESITDLAVGNLDGRGRPEIVAVGYSKSTGSTRTVARVIRWDGTNVDWGQPMGVNLGSEDYLHRLALADMDADGLHEIILAGWVKTGSTRD